MSILSTPGGNPPGAGGSGGAEGAVLYSEAQSLTSGQQKQGRDNILATTILAYANVAAFPVTGAANTIYHALDTDAKYLWNGAAYEDFSTPVEPASPTTAGIIKTAANASLLAGTATDEAVTPEALINAGNLNWLKGTSTELTGATDNMSLLFREYDSGSGVGLFVGLQNSYLGTEHGINEYGLASQDYNTGGGTFVFGRTLYQNTDAANPFLHSDAENGEVQIYGQYITTPRTVFKVEGSAGNMIKAEAVDQDSPGVVDGAVITLGQMLTVQEIPGLQLFSLNTTPGQFYNDVDAFYFTAPLYTQGGVLMQDGGTISLPPWIATAPHIIFSDAGSGVPGLGFFGQTPAGQQTLAAAATDPASTQTLANSLRGALINLGLGV